MTDSPSDPATGPGSDDATGRPDLDSPTTAWTNRPTWLAPAAIGVVLGVVIAMVAVLFTRSDDSSSASNTVATTVVGAAEPDPTVATPPETEPATTPPAPLTTAAPDPTTAPTDVPPASDVPAGTAAPGTTVAPATTAAPATTIADPGGPADDGMVRVGGVQHPIVRTCVTAPFAPNGSGFVVFSYLFFADNGAPQIVDHWFDEGGVTGGSYSDNGIAVPTGYEFLGADEFAVTVRRGDSSTRVVVNPPADGPTECAGTLTTNDPATPEFRYARSILDVCFGSQTGQLQYIGALSEGGRFSAIPNGDGTATLHYVEPFAAGFVDTSASVTEVDGNVEVRGTASGDGFTGAVTKDITVVLRADATRDCAVADIPF